MKAHLAIIAAATFMLAGVDAKAGEITDAAGSPNSCSKTASTTRR